MYSGPHVEDNSTVNAHAHPTALNAVAAPVEIGALLRLGPQPLSFYWSQPEEQVWVAGLGVAAEGLAAITWEGGSAPAGLPGPYCGGFAFDARALWEQWPAERWFVPQVLAWQQGTRTFAAAFGAEDFAQLHARLRGIDEGPPAKPPGPFVLEGVDRAAWEAQVRAALGRLADGALQKVVAARTLTVRGPVDTRRVLKVLEARNPGCRTFLVRGADGSQFLGSSPEWLARGAAGRLSTDALAGTAALGEAGALLGSAKDRREHQLVVEGIRARLLPLSSALEVPAEPSVLTLANMVHLRTPIRAQLLPGVTALQAAHALSPTPAVAGTPREAAVAFIAEHEPHPRGWYAGAVGLRSEEGVDLAVPLRCALVRGERSTIFVGAGLVEGSTPEGEWAETERKAQTMLRALGVDHG
jgi:salicylate biosynthesis isochorismate synthase